MSSDYTKPSLGLIKRIGYAASVVTVGLWAVLLWFNPYFNGLDRISFLITLIMLVLPAVLFSVGLALSRSLILLISFIWSFPYSLYMLLTPSIFKLFGVTCFIYLLCFVLFRVNKIKY